MSPSAIGTAFQGNLKEKLERNGLAVRKRTLNGRTLYIVAPQRTVEQEEAGRWRVIFDDEGRIDHVQIDPNDPEAQPEDWTEADDEKLLSEMSQWAASVDPAVTLREE